MLRPLSRRSLFAALAAVLAGVVTGLRGGFAVAAGNTQTFVDKAFEMKRLAESAGDQSYGAIIVRGEAIVGLGPSRVIAKKDATAHAEREAIRDAQAKLGASDLSGCVMYSTSMPCSDCQRTAARAKVARMYYGPSATDAGAPRG
jgi:tRNA(Arg) A34 adenosine deaminase TadA